MADFSAVKMQFPVFYPNPDMLRELTAGCCTPTPEKVRQVLGELVFPAPKEQRPYLYGCMVLSFDGKMGFVDDPEGTLISKENGFDPDGALADFWMMNVCRAYADAVILGCGTLKARLHKLWYAEIADPDLVRARGTLGKTGEEPLSVIASVDGRDLPLEAKILDRDPAPLILTSLPGAAYLEKNLGRACRRYGGGSLLETSGTIRIVAAGNGPPDTEQLMHMLWLGGVRHASVEAPGYIWHLMGEQLLDEYLLNYSGVMAGGSQILGATRPFATKQHPHAALLSLGYHRGFIFTRQKMLYSPV